MDRNCGCLCFEIQFLALLENTSLWLETLLERYACTWSYLWTCIYVLRFYLWTPLVDLRFCLRGILALGNVVLLVNLWLCICMTSDISWDTPAFQNMFFLWTYASEQCLSRQGGALRWITKPPCTIWRLSQRMTVIGKIMRKRVKIAQGTTQKEIQEYIEKLKSKHSPNLCH